MFVMLRRKTYLSNMGEGRFDVPSFCPGPPPTQVCVGATRFWALDLSLFLRDHAASMLGGRGRGAREKILNLSEIPWQQMGQSSGTSPLPSSPGSEAPSQARLTVSILLAQNSSPDPAPSAGSPFCAHG